MAQYHGAYCFIKTENLFCKVYYCNFNTDPILAEQTDR